jgi:hypothetical protein
MKCWVKLLSRFVHTLLLIEKPPKSPKGTFEAQNILAFVYTLDIV